MIMDTDFVIDLLKNDPVAVQKLRGLNENEETLIITAMTVFELFNGISRSDKPEREKEKVVNVLERQIIFDFDKLSAEKGGEICGLLAKQGTQIGSVDCMIAGIALNKNETVLTRNIKDFSKVKGLNIESY